MPGSVLSTWYTLSYLILTAPTTRHGEVKCPGQGHTVIAWKRQHRTQAVWFYHLITFSKKFLNVHLHMKKRLMLSLCLWLTCRGIGNWVWHFKNIWSREDQIVPDLSGNLIVRKSSDYVISLCSNCFHKEIMSSE